MTTAPRARIAATVLLVLLVLAVAMPLGRYTLATFTGQRSAGPTTFSTSSIQLTLNPATAVVSYSGMMPGDSVTNSLVVTNSGQAALRYAISSSATNADAKVLKDQLTLTIRTIDATTPASPCNDFDGTQLYIGDLDSTAGKLVGDNTPGAQAGDRTLSTAASETLCFRAALPATTGNAFRSATTTATFTFDAEQTANNP
jgi:hypothetical protein